MLTASEGASTVSTWPPPSRILTASLVPPERRLDAVHRGFKGLPRHVHVAEAGGARVVEVHELARLAAEQGAGDARGHGRRGNGSGESGGKSGAAWVFQSGQRCSRKKTRMARKIRGETPDVGASPPGPVGAHRLAACTTVRVGSRPWWRRPPHTRSRSSWAQAGLEGGVDALGQLDVVDEALPHVAEFDAVGDEVVLCAGAA